MKEKSRLSEYAFRKYQEGDCAKRLANIAGAWVDSSWDLCYERLLANNERKGIKRGVTNYVRDFPGNSRQGCGSEIGYFPKSDIYVDEVLQLMAKVGNPLAEQILEFRKTNDDARSNMFYWNRLYGEKGIIESMILRTMTESEYYGLINGEIPIGRVYHRFPQTQENSEEVHLKSQKYYLEEKVA